MTIILENIRSAWNVGSIFRTCDALGADLVLVGYTPCPTDKNLKLINKTAIGAENMVQWTHFDHSSEALESYSSGCHIAIEINSTSKGIFEYLKFLKASPSTGEIYLWFGNEIHGVSQLVQERSNACLHLPMNGMKESLNVANCVCSVGYLFAFARTFA